MRVIMNLTRRIFSFFKYMLFLVLSVSVLLELIFILLPVSDTLKLKDVNSQNPILSFSPERYINRQTGFDFFHVRTKYINNYGYASDQNFRKNNSSSKPVVAIIGDSYVEALQVANSDTFHGLIQNRISVIDFYPLGISGSQLSQYLAFSKFASENFSPDAYIFSIVGNDFDESYYSVNQQPGFHYFLDSGELTRVDKTSSLIKNVLRNSAFLRYLHLDLKISAQLQRIKEGFSNDDGDNIGLSKATFHKSAKNVALGKLAIDLFLEKLPEVVAEKRVILVLDGDRTSIYSGNRDRNAGTYESICFNYLIDKATASKNIEVIDMHDIFQKEWFQNKKMFNYSYDGHWNELGHSLVADAIFSSSLIKEMIK